MKWRDRGPYREPQSLHERTIYVLPVKACLYLVSYRRMLRSLVSP